MSLTRTHIDPSSIEDYAKFLSIKALPKFRFIGRTAEYPSEYAGIIEGTEADRTEDIPYEPLPGLFDYQEGISRLAIQKRKFAAFVEPGYGKTLMYGEFIRHSLKAMPRDRQALMVCPLMVVPQAIAEYQKFYGDKLPIEHVKSSDVQKWLRGSDARFGVTNWEAMHDDLDPGKLGCLVPDESSLMKSHYGKQGGAVIKLGRGLEWKMAGTGTPAPNDRIEYANHAVFLDHYPTVNSFLARFFVNRGETANRWEIKKHAIEPFYRALSHWCIFLTNPATYGWKDNAGTLPPIAVKIHDVSLSQQQRQMVMDRTGDLFGMDAGGITSRSQLGQIAKGSVGGVRVETNKPAFVRSLVDSWPDKSTLIWCIYDAEQESIASAIPDAASMTGSTPYEKRVEMLDGFKSGRIKTLISKAKILGFGQNLQICQRMIFSGLQDSFEAYWQCVKRANRVGSTEPLEVHIPITPIERKMVDTVIRKAHRVQADTNLQEQIFKRARELAHAA